VRILVIAPHPDDEVLGCGGTIYRHSSAGDEVYLCVVTEAYTPDWSEEFIANRVEEVVRSSKILGIKMTYCLKYPTVKLDTIPQKMLNESIAGIVDEVEPEIVYIPHKGDLNKDHRLVFEASLVATRPANHIVQRILSYETLSETEWGIEPFVPNVYVPIWIRQKIEAMEAYGSEVKPYPHPRSTEMIKALAMKRGSEVGVGFAEAFMLIREVMW